MTSPSELLLELERLRGLATQGKWECKDAPHAPFDGIFRILGPFWPTHVDGESFDDRGWLGEFHQYDNAMLVVALVNAFPALREAIEQNRVDAERYRWLRNCRGIKLPTQPEDRGWTFLYADDADTLIDAHRSKL